MSATPPPVSSLPVSSSGSAWLLLLLLNLTTHIVNSHHLEITPYIFIMSLWNDSLNFVCRSFRGEQSSIPLITFQVNYTHHKATNRFPNSHCLNHPLLLMDVLCLWKRRSCLASAVQEGCKQSPPNYALCLWGKKCFLMFRIHYGITDWFSWKSQKQNLSL